jgi:hypothetical protein
MKIIINKNKRIIAYTKIGNLEGAIEVEEFDFIHQLEDYIYEKGKIIYSPDLEKIKKEYFENIDRYKVEILKYGFDYKVNGKEHRQRCRDKDIAYMVANIVALQTAKTLGIEKTITWYFEDNVGITAGLQELGQLMLYGTTFVQSVYDTENYFKTLEEPMLIKKEDYENKIKEFMKNSN